LRQGQAFIRSAGKGIEISAILEELEKFTPILLTLALRQLEELATVS
jgi:hypothetical protein